MDSPSKRTKREFPRLDPHRIDIASRWAIRWLVRHYNKPSPDGPTLARYLDQLADAFDACESHLHFEWVQANTRIHLRWRRELVNLKRNPKRLRDFAAKEPFAQILRFGAARLDATYDLDSLLAQVEADPELLERIIAAALQKDVAPAKKRLLHDAGGRPDEIRCYLPLVHAAAGIFSEITARPLRRSTTSVTTRESHLPGKASGPGVALLRRLLAAFPRPFTDEAIAHLIREARSS